MEKSMKTNVAIVGYGFVGKATEYLLKDSLAIDLFIHDPALGKSIDPDYWQGIDYAFICVPTPECEETGRLDVSIAVQEAQQLPLGCVPVIRSTVGPDQVEDFPEGTIFMPEFLRERHWKEDVDNPRIPLIIGADEEPISLIQNMEHPKTTTYVLTPELACMYKVARNSALAMTVAFANELAEACAVTGVNYPDLSALLKNDKDLANTHWDVPGPDGEFGFGGKCLPKDLSHLETLVYDDENLLAQALYINEQRRN